MRVSSMYIPWAAGEGGPAALPPLWQAHGQHLVQARGHREIRAAPATLGEFARWLEP